jgi:tripartite-type tricarboxylate transporter receptor subunit TctC
VKAWQSAPALIAGILAVVSACAPPAAAPPVAPRSGPAEVVAATPSRPIEFVISTPPGGGSDIYARFIQSIIEKNQLSPQPVIPVNREGGAGAVAFSHVFDKRGDMHFIMITLNSFFTTLIAQKDSLPFQHKDFTPIANLALDPFFLWVTDDSPWLTAGDFIAAAKASEIIVAGTGAKQEDEILFNLIQTRAGTRPFRYVSFPGGGQVAAALAGAQVQATVNNPSEGLSLYQGTPRRLRPICTFASTSPMAGPYQGLPTCKSQGLDVGIEYFIMRSVMGPPGLKPEEVKFHADLMRKVYESEEWKEFAERNVLDLKFLSGAEFGQFLDSYNQLHLDVMKAAGWIQ